ncbi:MAG: PAS domain S-box protein, partial [Deltaproteobacteria bacterium]|nr:PAS domain S-box protein [Deltaproteobacteria bacterium]
MAKKPTYKELEQKVSELDKEIVKLKQTKEALKQSEERYRTLVEKSFNGIFVQKGSKIIFSNQLLNEMLGYDEGELLGLDHWLVYHPDYQQVTRKRAQARMRGEYATHQYEVKLQRKDGSWFYGEINARAISFEEEYGMQVWVRDITDRKRSEEDLRTRQTYLESVLHSAPDAIVTLDASHRILEWNPGAEKIFGYTRHEAVGKNLDDLVTGPDVIDESKKLTTQVLSGGKVLPRETVRYRKDGIPVNVIAAGSPIIIKGKLQGVVAVYTDITSRKKAEKEKINLESQLLQAQKMEAIGTLAGGIAHN